ncbi:hypothetical protein B0T14DRAFT_578977 [Immersiella caudata]|uniref:Uncharacterized protein n=1 Tax=Immersiella caudata TaxID=314043 RepID=A0AA39X4D1_9PEZI|nr:hypothetical protein B0T14DRAFT_578977 [Immersiella caudata]
MGKARQPSNDLFRWARLPVEANNQDRVQFIENLRRRGIVEHAEECYPAATRILGYIHSMQMVWMNRQGSSTKRGREPCNHAPTKRQMLQEGGGPEKAETSLVQHNSSDGLTAYGMDVINLSHEAGRLVPSPTYTEVRGAVISEGDVDRAGERTRTRTEREDATDGHQSPPTEPMALARLLSPTASQLQDQSHYAGLRNDSDPQLQGQTTVNHSQFRPTHDVSHHNGPNWWHQSMPTDQFRDFDESDQSARLGVLLRAAEHVGPTALLGSETEGTSDDFDLPFNWYFPKQDMAGIL